MPQLPEQLATRLTQQFGAAAVSAIVKGMSTDRLPTVRVNTLVTDDHAVMNAFRESGVQFERIQGVPHALRIKNRRDRELLEHPLAIEGKIYLQGVASMLPPIALDPQPGERVLDMCAAPGSKTSQLAAMMQNQGSLVAVEENEIRYQKLLNTITTQHVTNVEVLHQDAAMLGATHAGQFDKVLADVPCSAEGRIHLADARSYKFWSQKNVTQHAKLQRRLLRAAIQCLKPGGMLVYSTCTLAPEENEEQVAWLRSEEPRLTPVDIDVPLASVRHPGKGMMIVLPTTTHEGFFIAKLTLRP